MFFDMIESDPLGYSSWIIIAIFSICCHEYGHAWTAVYYGDNTPRNHLTLNPMIQMGPRSLLLLCILGLAWGSVPVNPAAVRKNHHRAMISFAGPLVNLFLCLFFAFPVILLQRTGWSEPIHRFFITASALNGALFLLNMLPIPMLDGFSVLSAFNPKLEEIKRQHAPKFFLLFILLLFVGHLSEFIFLGGTILSRMAQSMFIPLFHLFGLS